MLLGLADRLFYCSSYLYATVSLALYQGIIAPRSALGLTGARDGRFVDA